MAQTWRRFGGFNIKGTPKMAAPKVLADLRVIQKHCDVFVMQEFRWPWYWTALGALRKWHSYPRVSEGVLHPTMGAQGVVWKREAFRQRGHRMRLLHDGEAGISEDRYLRAVLLEDRQPHPDGMRCWFGSTHFVVHGDGPGDGPIRKAMLAGDLRVLSSFLDQLRNSGWPIIFELDANIHVGTAAYSRLVQIVEARGGKFYGHRGVEYLFVINGKKGTVIVREPWTIPTSQLNTDHEGRGLTFRLSRPA